MGTDKSADDFRQSLKGKKVPVLTLDTKWHHLFRKDGKPDKIEKLESVVNEHLKRQGKLTTDIQSMKKEKKKLMDSIVQNMDTSSDSTKEEILEANQDRIRVINETMEKYEDELLDLPRFIKESNEELMIEGMDIFYHQLMEMAVEVEEIDEWIRKIRVELKKNIIRKQDMEKKSQMIYNYLHSIFGPEIIEIFDMKYMRSLAQKQTDLIEKDNKNKTDEKDAGTKNA